MKAIGYVVAVGVLLAGCAQTMTIWRKPGATQDEERLIMQKCQYESEAHSPEGMESELNRELRVHKLKELCLKANGMVIVQSGVPYKGEEAY